MSNLEAGTAIDLSELALFVEAEANIDPEANMDDAPPPPPEFDSEGREIKYLVTPEMITDKATQKQVKVIKYQSAGRDVQGLAFFGLDCTIIDEGKPWNKSRLRSWPSTRLMNQTTEVDQILKAYLGGQYASERAYLWPVGKKVNYLVEQFSAQRPFRVTVRWECSAPKKNADGTPSLNDAGKQEYENVRKGMKNFPTRELQDGTVVHVPLTEHPTTGEEVRTQARIISYYPA